jgi:integrase
MGKAVIKPFQVKIIHEGNYDRLYITHPNFAGRIKKRIGKDSTEESENIKFHLKYELENHFATNDLTKESATNFIENYVSLRIKFNASIFDYFDDYIEIKKKAINKRTKSRLVKPTITSYESAKSYFEKFLIKNRLPAHPSAINREVLDNFYNYIDGAHNYRVKLHRRIKAFITFLDGKRGIQIDPSYKLSVFTEEYDNQDPEEDDIALTTKDVKKLIDLRKRLNSGEAELEMYEPNRKISENLQKLQFKMKKENLIRCLDCFLFMVSTGQYHSDIKKSTVNLSREGSVMHLRYRRAKNSTLCKAIPVRNFGVFIGQELIDQYNIKNGTNFPLNLSLTHFNLHLERISELSELGFKLNNKMARKTFASILYYDYKMPIHLLQILLGHKNVSNTAHYLRISDENLAAEVDKIMFRASSCE